MTEAARVLKTGLRGVGKWRNLIEELEDAGAAGLFGGEEQAKFGVAKRRVVAAAIGRAIRAQVGAGPGPRRCTGGGRSLCLLLRHEDLHVPV